MGAPRAQPPAPDGSSARLELGRFTARNLSALPPASLESALAGTQNPPERGTLLAPPRCSRPSVRASSRSSRSCLGGSSLPGALTELRGLAGKLLRLLAHQKQSGWQRQRRILATSVNASGDANANRFPSAPADGPRWPSRTRPCLSTGLVCPDEPDSSLGGPGCTVLGFNPLMSAVGLRSGASGPPSVRNEFTFGGFSKDAGFLWSRADQSVSFCVFDDV